MAGLLHCQPHRFFNAGALRESAGIQARSRTSTIASRAIGGTQMNLALIISTYEQPLALAKVLRGVEQQTRWPNEIFIADDGSGTATRELIVQWRRQAKVPVQHLWHPHEGFRKVILLNKA